MDIPGFELDWTPERDVAILRIVGRVDGGDLHRVEEASSRLVAGGQRRVVLDCSRAEGPSSAGLGVVIYYRNLLARMGGELVMAAPRGAVLRSIRAAGIDKAVPIFDTLEEAVEAVRKG